MQNPLSELTDVLELSRRVNIHPIEGRLAYATCENFLGRLVKGYSKEASQVCLLMPVAARRLCEVQKALNSQSLSLYIFDAFRPLRAVQDFAHWFSLPPASSFETERKLLHYPHLEKTDLSRLGYASSTISSHCYGAAVDLTLKCLKTQVMLDMGTIFDYFDPASHADAPAGLIGKRANENRKLLMHTMEAFGFKPYPYEWWHFEYEKREASHPLDTEITPALKGQGVDRALVSSSAS